MHTVIWKRIAISIGLTFAVLVSSVPLNLISAPQASAASSVYNDLSLEDKAKFYAYYWLMQTCFKDSAIETNAAKVAEGKLFYDKPINIGTAQGVLYNYAVGGADFSAGGDGTSTCGATDSEFSTLALDGLHITAIDLVCAMGYTRQNQGGGNGCLQGTNDFNDWGGIPDGATRVAKFTAYIASQTGWTAAAAVSDGSEFVYDKTTLINACTQPTPVGSFTGFPANMQYPVAAVTSDGSDTVEKYVGRGDHNHDWKVNDFGTKRTCGQILDNLQASGDNFKEYKTALTKTAIVKGCTDHGYKDIPSGSFPGSSELSACIGGGLNKTSPTYCATTWKDSTYQNKPLKREAERSACRYGQTGKFTINVPNTGQTGNEAQSTCAIPSIGWIVCPIVTAIANTTDGIYNVISGMLVTDVQTLAVGGGTYNAWQGIRTFANVGFVIVFLIIIFSQLSSVGISNYGVKKLLPRLVVVAILVNVSFFLCQIIVDISNILGGTVPSLFGNIAVFGQADSFDDSGNSFSSLAVKILAGTFATSIAGAAAGIGVVVIMYTGVGLFVPIALAALLAVLVTVFILIARNVLIILLVAIAPLAFLAMMLPNTENLFKQWRKMFVGMLLVYPMIAVLFGASKLASNIILASGASTFQQLFMGMAALFIPLFATPILLKNSLNAIPAIGNIATKLQARTNGLVGKSAKEFYKATPIARGMAIRKQARANYRDQKFAEDVEAGGVAGLMARGVPGLNKMTNAGKYADRALSRSALGATEKADTEDVSAEKTSMLVKRLTLPQLQIELQNAILKGDSVKARAAQSILVSSGEAGKVAHDSAMRSLDTTLASAAAAVSAGTATEEQRQQNANITSGYDSLRRNLKFNHSDIKGSDAIADKFMNAASGTSYSDASTQMTSGGGLAGLNPTQFINQPIEYLKQSGIKKAQAQELLNNDQIKAIMSPEKRTYLASIK